MPNWCKGNIRFRGTTETIKRFLMNEIVCCRMGEDHLTVEEAPEIEDREYCLIIKKPKEHSWFYIKGTHRNFFDDDVLEIWIDEDNPQKEVIICIENFKAAWSFERCDKWREFAKQYNFDVRMVGYDRNMHFSQIKTICRDGREKDVVHEYEDDTDWMWNCPQPNNGG